jgi:hypothetical protein
MSAPDIATSAAVGDATIQLGQVIGVAVFGAVFFSLLKAATTARPLASASALRTACLPVALLAAVAILPGLAFARGLRAR